MKKIIAFLVCLAIGFAACPIATYAANEEVMPLSNNTSDCICSFGINSYGHATIGVSYYGYQGITTGGSITIQMQKKFLGLFWRDVEGKYWELSSNQVNYSYQNVVQLSDTGKYRIVVNFTIYGTGGAADQFEKTAEAEW